MKIGGNTSRCSSFKIMKGRAFFSEEGKQAAAKQTFVFLAPLANEYPAKQDAERVSAYS